MVLTINFRKFRNCLGRIGSECMSSAAQRLSCRTAGEAARSAADTLNSITMKDKDLQEDLLKQLEELKKRRAEAHSQMEEAAAAFSITEVD